MTPSEIIIHHSLTKDSDTVSWGAIREYHIKHNKFSDIGYHWGIEEARGTTEVFMGRVSDKPGAHCKGQNSKSIGICFVGNFDVDQVPPDMWWKGVALCEWLIRTYSIKIIIGHNEYNSTKSCPGKYFNMSRFRREVFM